MTGILGTVSPLLGEGTRKGGNRHYSDDNSDFSGDEILSEKDRLKQFLKERDRFHEIRKEQKARASMRESRERKSASMAVRRLRHDDQMDH